MGFGMWILGCVVFASGCAARRFQFPADSGTPFPDFAAVYTQLTMACAATRTLTTELSLSGRAGGQTLRGRVIAGFARPASMRLEGVAPFGPPAFILAASDETGTLLLPRDNRVLQGARAEDLLGALTAVALAPADLQAILTGCVVPDAQPAAGHTHRNGTASIDLTGGATMYVERDGGRWRIRAATRSGWDIEYPEWQGDFPARVRLRSRDPGSNVDLTAGLSQLEANVDLTPAAFTVDIPPRAVPMTLEELRTNGPIRTQ